MRLLKHGDPCPCCGKRIRTKNREQLALMTMYAKAKALVSAMEDLHGKEKDGTP